MHRISLALVEDDVATRRRLATALTASSSIELLCAVGTVAEIVDWLGDNTIDVLLVDLGLPDGSGLDVIRACRRLQPACEVMVLTMFADEVNMLNAFEAGARGYLLKDGTEEDLGRHVQDLYVGGSPMSPIVARRLLTRWTGATAPASTQAPPPTHPVACHAYACVLTGKERKVLDLVARGFTYPEVAGQLGVSVTTVRTHVRSIYAKLEVHNKAEALFEARQMGLLT